MLATYRHRPMVKSDEMTTMLVGRRELSRLERIKRERDLGSKNRALRLLLDHFEESAKT